VGLRFSGAGEIIIVQKNWSHQDRKTYPRAKAHGLWLHLRDPRKPKAKALRYQPWGT